MSITAMSLIWPIRIPPPEKLVLMRLADFADDDGGHVFPSLRRLADETGFEERSVRRILRRLEGEDDKRRPALPRLLAMVAEADPMRKRPREYRIMVDELRRLSDEAKAAKRADRRSPVSTGGGGTLATGRGDPMSPVGGTLGPGTGDPMSPRSIKSDPPSKPTMEETHTPAAGAAGERVAGKPLLRLVPEAKPEETAEPAAAGAEIPAPAEPETSSPSKAARGCKLHSAEIEAAFGEFWKIYPRHVARVAALKAYGKALKGGASPAEILIGCRRFAEKVARDGTEAQYIPHGATWLNAARWTDEPEPKAGPKIKSPFLADLIADATGTRPAGLTGNAAAIWDLHHGDGDTLGAHAGETIDLEAETTTEGRAA